MESVLHVLKTRVSDGPALAFCVLTLALIIGPRIAEKVRLPAMVGLVLAGMVVGQHGIGILDSKEISLSALGSFGLLYLMFAAGLELDLKLFMKMKKAAIIFAALSFAIPLTAGIVSARLLGYAWAGAVLMGSNWSSHTLVTYPMLRQMGLSRNRAVATVVGATAVTDTSALLVLTGVSASVRKAGGFGVQALEIAAGLAFLVFWTLVVLPRVGRWFFARVGTDGSYRFIFGMTAFLTGAVVAQMASIDGIVGAFFAGIGLGRAIPERSPLMERVQFFGSAFFIPIFLVSVGILLNPKVLFDPRTLLVALVFTVAVLGGKTLAAVIAGRVFHFTWPEIGVMSGLSGSQAAATLATTLVGTRLGVFDERTVNAVLVVILASLVVTPAVVSHFGKRVTRAESADEGLGSAVLVPVVGDSTRPLLRVAARLAATDGGLVVAASFATQEESEARYSVQRGLRDKAELWLAKEGLECRAIFRVSTSLAAGLVQTLRGEGATLLLAEWPQPDASQLGGSNEAFQLASRPPVPVLLAHGEVERCERLLLVAPGSIAPDGDRESDLKLAAELTKRLANGHPVACVAPSLSTLSPLFPLTARMERAESSDPLAWVKDHAKSGDLLVFAGLDMARAALERLPGLADKGFVVAIGVHGATP